VDVLEQPARLLTANSKTSNLGFTVFMTAPLLQKLRLPAIQVITLLGGGGQRISVEVTGTRLRIFY
jgi:hypothetical protein